MASLSYLHLPSLILLLINILYTATNGDSVKPSNPACPSFDCGDGQIIGYPFWQQGNQNEHCGYPGLAVSCNHQQPQLRLFDHFYGLKKINYSENTLTAAYPELNDATRCPMAPHDVKLNSTSFLNYTIEDKMRSYVFMEGAIPEFDWHRYCEGTVRVPVIFAGDRESLLRDHFGRVLKEGFKLTWRSPDSGCRSCEASGGFCGYRSGLNQKSFCFCKDGKHSDNCHNEGDVILAFEPDFVAIGALICGGLIVATTVFYIVQKKKIALQKPAFSRIPTSGKS
ncbi:hypothetical protein Vadar_012442 [Vaccinium darrowii]|uniref:Uncharacterized protein n=1 Tax=Vaccinium darrowii TaxID=229202 RepID=A0ACB7XQC0_9ERIC|nr:hypothetical protein Vadar_012442 [Vaccinium darrowii]